MHDHLMGCPAGIMQQHAAEVDSVAIITGYKMQEMALRARFRGNRGVQSTSNVYFGTVDGFQASKPA